MSDFKEILSIAEELTNGKEFLLGYVVDRLRKAASQFPQNQAIRTMEQVVTKRFNKAGGSISIINQKQIQDIYNQVSGLGPTSQVRSTIDDLLLVQKPVVASHVNEQFIHGMRDHAEPLAMADEDHVNELKEALFQGKVEPTVKRAFLENGRRGVQIELESFGIQRPNVEIAAADSNFVIYAAEVNTRRGKVPFLIPAEIKQGSVLMPSVFVSGNNFVDLTASNVRTLLAHADIKKTATPKAILDSLNRLTGKVSVATKVSTASDDAQLSCFAAPETFASIHSFGQPEAQAPVPQMPEELKELSQSGIKETLVEAGLSYPRATVLAAKATLSNEIKLANLGHDKILVEAEFDGGIILSTNLISSGGKKRIDVPIEVENGKVCLPSRFTSGAFASPFSDKDLRAFASSSDGEQMSSMLTDKYDLTFTELHKLALNKAAYQDFVNATECLSVIHDKFGPEFYRVAHNDLMDLLRVGYATEEKTASSYDKFIQTASEKAKNKEEHIKLTANPMLFYPRD